LAIDDRLYKQRGRAENTLSPTSLLERQRSKRFFQRLFAKPDHGVADRIGGGVPA
jgi:hypothetical protein